MTMRVSVSTISHVNYDLKARATPESALQCLQHQVTFPPLARLLKGWEDLQFTSHVNYDLKARATP